MIQNFRTQGMITNNSQTNHTFRKRILKFCLLSTALFTGYMDTSMSMEKEPFESTLDLSDRFLKGSTYKQQDYLALVPLINNSTAQVFQFDGNLNIQAPKLIFEDDSIPEDLETYEKEIDGEIFTFGKDPFVEIIKAFVGNQHFKQASFRQSLNDSKISILSENWLNLIPSNLSNLQVLDLSHNKLDFGFVGDDIISVLENATQLKTLNLSHIPFGKQTSVFGDYLMNGLAKAPALEHLNLSNTQMRRELLGLIYDGIAQNPHIHYLDVSDNPHLDSANSIGQFSNFGQLHRPFSIIFKNNDMCHHSLNIFGELLIPEFEDEINFRIITLDALPKDDARNSMYVDLSRTSLPKEDVEKLKAKVGHLYNIESNDEGKLIIRGKSLPETYVPDNPFISPKFLVDPEKIAFNRTRLLNQLAQKDCTVETFQRIALDAFAKGLDDVFQEVIKQWCAHVKALTDFERIGKTCEQCDALPFLTQIIDEKFPVSEGLMGRIKKSIAYAQSGLKEKAVQELDELTQNKDAFDVKTLCQIAHVYSMAENLGKMADLLEYAVEKAVRVSDYYMIASRYAQVYWMDRAKICLEKAYKVCSQNPELLIIATGYAEFGFKKQAIRILNELTAKAKNPIEYNKIALCYYEKLQMKDEARQLLERYQPFCRSSVTLATLAEGFYSIQQNDKAKEILALALNITFQSMDFLFIAQKGFEFGFNDMGQRALSIIENNFDANSLVKLAQQLNEKLKESNISDKEPIIKGLKQLLNAAISKAQSKEQLAAIEAVMKQYKFSDLLEKVSHKRKEFSDQEIKPIFV